MSVRALELPKLIAHWEIERTRHEKPVYALLLTTQDTAIERHVVDYLRTHLPMLDDMSGMYCALTLVIQRAHPTTPSKFRHSGQGEEALARVSSLEASQLDERGMGEACRRLGVDIRGLPSVLLFGDPWRSRQVFEWALGRVLGIEAQEHRITNDDLTMAFRSLFEACREGVARRHRRIAVVRARLRRDYASAERPGLIGGVIKTGIIAEVVRGIVEGIGKIASGGP